MSPPPLERLLMGKKSPGRLAGENRLIIFANQDPVRQAFMDGKTTINLKDYRDKTTIPQRKMPLSYIMLHGLLRNYVIKVKYMLETALINGAKEGILPKRAIILAAKLLPKPTIDNCYYTGTLAVMDIFDEFLECICEKRDKTEMEAVRDILLAEIEHDIHYSWIFLWFAEELTKAPDFSIPSLEAIFIKFFEHFYNANRVRMMRAARDLFLQVMKKEKYREYFIWFAGKIVAAINDGTLNKNEKDFPIKGCWRETV